MIAPLQITLLPSLFSYHEVPTNRRMWSSVVCPETAAVPRCEARSEGGGLSRPAHRRARRSPAAIFDIPPPSPPAQHTAEGRGGHLVAAPPGARPGSRPRRRLATAAEREGAWHGAAGGKGGGPGRAAGLGWAGRGDRSQPLWGQSRRSWWCGGGSRRVGGAEPFSGSGGGEGGLWERREPLPRVSIESWAPRAAGLRDGVFQLQAGCSERSGCVYFQPGS